MIDSAQLAEGLLRDGLIAPEKVAEVTGEQQRTGADLRDIVLRRGLLPEADLVRFIAKEQLIHFVDPDLAEVDRELMAKLPRQLIERHHMVALRGEHGALLALSEPDDLRAVEEVQFLSSRPVESALAPRSAIRRAIDRFYASPAAAHAHGPAPAPAPAPARRPAAAEAQAPRVAAGPRPPSLAPETAARIRALAPDVLLRALVLALIERGQVSAERLLSHAGGEARSASPEGTG